MARDSLLENLPRFETTSILDKVPNLSHFDVERNLFHEVNFKYYSPQDFLNSEDIQQAFSHDSFSTLHCNIRSLAANYDNLAKLLSDLHHTFNIIGLSETKIKKELGQIRNTSFPGYNFISQPTLSNAGGVGFYIKHGTQFHIRDDLSTMNMNLCGLKLIVTISKT